MMRGPDGDRVRAWGPGPGRRRGGPCRALLRGPGAAHPATGRAVQLAAGGAAPLGARPPLGGQKYSSMPRAFSVGGFVFLVWSCSPEIEVSARTLGSIHLPSRPGLWGRLGA